MNDLISRQALCEYALNQKDKSITPNEIMRFPSAEPEQKTGKWIIDDGHVCCSECGEICKEYNYCPYCGADMRGETNE